MNFRWISGVAVHRTHSRKAQHAARQLVSARSDSGNGASGGSPTRARARVGGANGCPQAVDEPAAVGQAVAVFDRTLRERTFAGTGAAAGSAFGARARMGVP